MAGDRRDLAEAVRHVLERHEGRDQPITMAALFAITTGETIVPGRRYDQTRIVRSLIEQLRREGLPVANSPRGYFLARDDEELAPTIRAFHQRAMSSLRQEKALKRVSFEDLLRQYELELRRTP